MTELRPFQLEGAKRIHQFGGRVLLADEQGLGKTIQVLYWLRHVPRRRPVVIVTPASMKYTWPMEAHLHFKMGLRVIEGNARKSHHPPEGEILVLNYELLKSWLDLLKRRQPQVVVFDECHFLKNLSAQRTRAAMDLVKRVPCVIGMSGTPMVNRPIELFPVLKMVNPDLFPSREKFAWRYCRPRYTPWGWVYDGATNLGELKRLLREGCMIRRLKKNVMKELPPKVRRIVPLKLPPSSMQEYRKAKEDFLIWLKAISPARAKRAERSQALTKIGYLIRLVCREKLRQVEKWIKDFFESHPGKKLVVLTMHTFVIDALKEVFPSALVIDGRVVGRKRAETVRRFQVDRNVTLLVGNWKAAGVGITLTAAHNGAALDLPWTPGDLMQGEDRLDRIGQNHRVEFSYLVAIDTIEESMINLLQRKARVLAEGLNDESSSGENDLDVLGELLNEIKATK